MVLPVIVLDELDGLKESNKEHTRRRARETLRWLAANLDSESPVRLRPHRDAEQVDERVPRGEVWLDVLLDDHGHHRLPIADDEIVDRAGVIASMAGRKVTLVTNDVSQGYRARVAGLVVESVGEPLYDIDIREAAEQERREAKQVGRSARSSGRSGANQRQVTTD